MRHRIKKTTFGRKKAPREAMLRNLAQSVVLYEKVTTTQAKAKAIRPIVEKLITRGSEPTLANRRQLMKYLYDEKAVNKILEVLGPKYKERPGGYTRITKLSNRLGDNAPMAVIEFV
ncbi:MAG: 50S ribosomal protein L17 [Parcubacteria group bacterium]|nr:50S ribosomal protein L17 [Parcubacteria group bacterium]|tara:strand:- start:71 stop:421 length:351 start_codon:yes stop_codon:yes gene_type:complete